MSSETLSIDLQLSGEEMLFLTDLLSLPDLPEGTSADHELDTETNQIRRTAGLNSLRARNLVQDDHVGRRVVVDNLLLAILVTCSQARKAIFFAHSRIGLQEDVACIHIHNTMAVVHRRERPGIDRFIAALDRATLIELIQKEMILESTGKGGSIFTEIHNEIIREAFQAVSNNDIGTSINFLVENGAQRSSAELFCNTLTKPYSKVTVVAMDGDEQREHQLFTGLSLIDAPDGIWSLGPGSGEGFTIIEHIAREEVYQRINQVVEGFLVNWQGEINAASSSKH